MSCFKVKCLLGVYACCGPVQVVAWAMTVAILVNI